MKLDRFTVVVLLAISLGAVASGQNGINADKTNSDQPIELPDLSIALDPAMAVEVDRLILDLGSPDYREREAATRRLMEIGVPAFAKLRDSYQNTDDLEVRLRTEVIVSDAFVNFQVFDRTGYLGISLATHDAYATHVNDARIAVGHFGFKLGKIVEDTAAAKARLKVDDIVTQVDGQPLGKPDMNAREAFGSFAKSIRDRGAGGKLRLTLLRRDQRLDVDVTLGAAPMAMMKRINGMSKLYNQSISQFDTWWVDNFSTSLPAMAEHGVGQN